MIRGLDRFRDHFEGYEERFVLIGGVAAMQWLDDAGLNPRATKDFDIVLLIERLDDDFLNLFWEFIRAGAYDNRQRSTGERIYYRFTAPQGDDYPAMLEIFSRLPQGIAFWEDATIVPIPAEEDASSLSAILMDEGYYQIVREYTQEREGLPLLSPQGLILLKAKAFLDLRTRQAAGERIDEKHIKKHRNDVFKLALLLTAEQGKTIPLSVHADLKAFLDSFPADAPEWGSIQQAAGLSASVMNPGALLEALGQAFQSS
jgi:hypothetical protein